MSKERNTLIIGAAQGIQMVTTFFRAKIISILLGATGFGIYSILISSIMFFQQVGSLGLNQAAIKELAGIYNEARVDKDEILSFKSQFLKCMIILAVCSGVMMLLFCLPLSLFFFDDNSHSLYFVGGAVALVFYALSQSFNTILQASRQLKTYAWISIYTAIFTLVSAAVFISLLGLGGLVISVIVGFVINSILGYRVMNDGEGRHTSIKQSFTTLRPIISRGVFIMFGSLSISLFTMLLNGVVSNSGVENVGYYQASVSVLSQGLIIVSMVLSIEFYPRICSVKDVDKLNTDFNEEVRMMLWVLLPIEIGLLWLAPVVVAILYAESFEIVPFLIRIMSLSLPFRLVWMASGYLILSRGEKYTYFIFDGLFGNGFNFVFTVIGFNYGSLIGLAWGWTFGALFVSIFLSIIVFVRYGVHLSLKNILTVILASIIAFGVFLVVDNSTEYMFIFQFIIGGVFIGTLFYSSLVLDIPRKIKSRLRK